MTIEWRPLAFALRRAVYRLAGARDAPARIDARPRVTPEQWERIEKITKEREVSANRLVVEVVMEALDRREWPRTELDIQVAKAALFAAQVLRRDLIADGRTDEVEEVLKFVSTLVPESAANPPMAPNPPPSRSDPQRGSE